MTNTILILKTAYSKSIAVMTQQNSKIPSFVPQHTRRINIKSKRRKNLIKKAIELRAMCGLDIAIIIKDNEFGKIQMYNMSGSHMTDLDIENTASNLFNHPIVKKMAI